MRNKLENFGSFEAIVVAAACPICFPKLALFGLGALAKYEVEFFWAAQILIVIGPDEYVISYKKNKTEIYSR